MTDFPTPRPRSTHRLATLTALVLLCGLAALGCGSSSKTEAPQPTTPTTTRGPDYVEPLPCPPAEGADKPTLEFPASPPECIDPAKTYSATFITTAGDITFALDTKTTPATTNNFVYLARYGYYDDTLLFRVDGSIGIIQGGSPKTNNAADPGPGYTIADEGEKFEYKPGQLVMARRAARNSASAQYFFTFSEKASILDAQGTYVVFGQTDEAGLKVLEKIGASEKPNPEAPNMGGMPVPEVKVLDVKIAETGRNR